MNRKLRDGEKILIENIINATSLADVLAAIADICNDKADHLAGNWQDDNAAKNWELCARRIDKVGAVAMERLGN